MTSIDGLAAEVIETANTRLTELDRLLPGQGAPQPGCGPTFTATGEAGEQVAVATCEHWTGEPGSIALTWGAARRFNLHLRIAGPDVPGALDQLLAQWHEHLAELPSVGEDDTAAVVTWPSRDVDGVRVLQRHGLAPLAVIAARLGRTDHADRAGDAAKASPDGVSIRRAGPADLDVFADLGLELVRYDAKFGEVVERPDTRDGLRKDSAGMLADQEPWVWLAERDGSAVGVVAVERPAPDSWMAPLSSLSPVAYLQQGFVLPAERAGGVGARLVRRCHDELDAAGVAVTLLHYSQANPLSVPFWSQQGYRPLWTVWEARPARRLC